MNLQRLWSEQLRWSNLWQQKLFRWVGLAILMMVVVIAIAFSPLKSYGIHPLQHEATVVSLWTQSTDQGVLPEWGDSAEWSDSPKWEDTAKWSDDPTLVATGYTPAEEVAPADPSNYGYRYMTDIDGNPANNAMIVVLHETVGSASSAINTFQTPHTNENNQVSYHSLIRRNGSIVHIVHPQMRAFGAGNSVFDGPGGPETVRTHPQFPGSVNNFAYHTSLESPSDGRGNQRRHSGYTDAQYQSLAWLIAHLPVPDERITTHKAVDRSGSRMDPRSFDGEKFLRLLHGYQRPY